MKFKKGASDVIDGVILSHAEKLLIYYANEYKERPKSLMNAFIKFDSIKMATTLIIFACQKNGILKELEGKKDFSEWVDKQNLEEKWKPVLKKFLLIIWGVTNQE